MILVQYPQVQSLKNQFHSCFKQLKDCTTSKEESEKIISSHQSTIDEIKATHKKLDEQRTQSSIEMHQLKTKVHKYDQTFQYIKEEEDNKTEHDETKTSELPQQRETTALPRPSKKQQPRVTPHGTGVKRIFTKCDEEYPKMKCTSMRVNTTGKYIINSNNQLAQKNVQSCQRVNPHVLQQEHPERNILEVNM